jgi:hypothetical protein
MYFPKSQIKPNLYTNGGEYILSTTKEGYSGYYYEISNGQKFTGKNPTDKPNTLLTKTYNIDPLSIPTSPNTTTYIQIANDQPKYFPEPYNNFDTEEYFNRFQLSKDSIYRSIPNFNQTLPTPQEVETGQYTRYFCKKNNELIYLEIDKNTFTQLQNKESKIAWDLYTPTSIVWNTRKAGLEPNIPPNYTSVLKIEKDLKWYGFSQYFKDNFD